MSKADDTAPFFNDVLLAALAGTVLIIFLLITHLNPPGAQETGDISQQGQLRVFLTWPDDIRADVDLWVEDPHDPRPVGYSRKTGAVFSLFRDDLGHVYDQSESNFEEAETRGIPAGEYVINAHLFSNRSGVVPIPVSVEVWTKASRELPSKRLFIRRGELLFTRHEITLVRFHIDESGHYVRGTLHDRHKPLRARRDR